MPDLRQILSDKAVARRPRTGEKPYKVRDTKIAGFFVHIVKRRKSLVVKGEFWRDGVREFTTQVKLGDFGDLTTRETRSKAKGALDTIADGEGLRESSRTINGITLRQAWERYRDAHLKQKKRNAGTIENYRDHMEWLFADWLDQPLSRLGRQPNLVVERHDKITEENGPYIANGSMRSLRAIYNHARKSNTKLPTVNPVTAVDWNKERRRNSGMGVDDVGAWLKELHALANPLRREFHLLTLLSGSRPAAVKNIRIKHIDLRQRLLNIPRPKGGEEKAFDIPLSRPMIRCIIRTIGRILYPEQASTWLFPAESESGHLEEQKEDRAVLSKWGNDLRQSYRTLAQAAGVSELDVHLLMNHSLPGVNAGYITRERLLRDHLRKQQECISAIVTEAAFNNDGRSGCWVVSAKLDTHVERSS